MFKRWWNNIKSWFSDLFNGRLQFGSHTDIWDDIHGKGDVMVNNAQANNELTSSSPYSGSDSVNDLYAQYNAVGGTAFNSLVNKYAEAGLTGQQAALNEMQMDNQRRQYAFNVQGMQEAGLNPALMYESGAQSAPSAPAPTQGASMSDLVQLLLARKQSNLLDAQARNTDADTDKKKAETEGQQLINKYYPQVTDTEIDKMLSEMGVNSERIKEIKSNIDLNELDKILKGVDIKIRKAEADESSAYYKATRQLQEAKTAEARASARASLARAFMDEVEGVYMQETNNHMGNNSLVALASALGTMFSRSDDFSRFIKDYIYDKDKKHGWLAEKLADLYDEYQANKASIAGASRGGGSRGN